MLANAVRSCTRCTLRQTCRLPVPGHGPRDAALFIVAQSPGGQEDERNIPLVGPSGKRLRETLETYGVNWATQTYRTNGIKCHPPGNRKGSREELAACRPWLDAELGLWQPPGAHLILAVGEDAALTLFPPPKGGKSGWFAKLRERTDLTYDDHPAQVILHPAATLRNSTQLPAFEAEIEQAVVRAGLREARPPYWEHYQDFEDVAGSPMGGPCRVLGLDTEFDTAGNITAWSLSWTPGQALVFLKPDLHLDLLGAFVWETDALLAIHSAQADAPVISRACQYPLNLFPWARVRDTAIAAYVARDPKTGLKALALQHFGIKMIRFQDIVGEGFDAGDRFPDLPREVQVRYAGGDADMARRLLVEKYSWALEVPTWPLPTSS